LAVDLDEVSKKLAKTLSDARKNMEILLWRVACHDGEVAEVDVVAEARISKVPNDGEKVAPVALS
jgi:uncharacterized tellurite resistance protein B-like protein